MTEQEAMIRLDFIRCALLGGTKPEIIPNEDNVELMDNAIKVLEDVQQYRAIGTLEECRVAVEKQKPMKPSESSCSEKTHYRCPNCGYIPLTVYANGYRLGNKPDFCEKCGKAIDWSDTNDKLD